MLGGTRSLARTADQSEIAWFWVDDAGTTTPIGYASRWGPAACRGGRDRLRVFQPQQRKAGRSRIYGGIHWEFDNADGLATGRALGEFVGRSFLLPQGQLSKEREVQATTAQRRKE